MSAERDDPMNRPAAEPIDLEVMDDGPQEPGEGNVSMEDFMKMGPNMIMKYLRDIMLQKVKRWFIRNLVIFTVLSLLAMEYKWATWIMYIWAFFAGLHLAILIFAWYMSGKQASKLAGMMRGFGNPPER
ncbi:MAG TPA: hypothetical protein VHM91_17315 [Verrucomicrobiales bacterium]|nr:hypothetical protein [Verrucomicrobiales bacterium]